MPRPRKKTTDGVRQVQVPEEGRQEKVNVYYREPLSNGRPADLDADPNVDHIRVLRDPNGVIWGVEVHYTSRATETVLAANIRNLRFV